MKTTLLNNLTNLTDALPLHLFMKSGKNVPIRTESAWKEEKTEIHERANWLCNKVIVEPKKLLKGMPSVLGEEYGGQWAIYSCSMLSAALLNISRLYPEEKERCIERLEQLVRITLSPEIRHYDTIQWKKDALETLSGNSGHMTYLSILAWVISNYKLAGGTSNDFDQVFLDCCEALNRRTLLSKNLCLPSFPNGIIFLPDMLVTIVALKNHGILFDERYDGLVGEWIEKAKAEWIHHNTGLVYSQFHPRSTPQAPRGCYTALSCYYLTLVDADFAQHQYERMIATFAKEENVSGKTVFGIKEYLKANPKMKLDVNAGPVFHGFSPSGSAWAIGSATYFEDWETRSRLLRTAEMAGGSVKHNGKRHYRLASFALVGEAVVLAMRTNRQSI